VNEETDSALQPGVAVVGGRAGVPGGDDAGTVQPSRYRRRRLRSGQPRWLVPVLMVVTAVSIVLTIAFAMAWSNLEAQQNARATVRRVASDFLLALTNFKPTTVDSDFRAISSYATGDFAKQSDQFFGSHIRQELETAQASSEGQLRYLYIQSLEGNRASVYAEVDQTYANAKVTTPVADVLQVALVMVDTSSGWKISEVSVLQPPSSPGAPTGNAGAATGGGG
jgi:hypothetical protein